MSPASQPLQTPLFPPTRPAAGLPDGVPAQPLAASSQRALPALRTYTQGGFSMDGTASTRVQIGHSKEPGKEQVKIDRIETMKIVQAYQAGRMTRREFGRKLLVALGSVSAANVLLAACAPITPEPRPVVAEPTAAGEPVEGVTSGVAPTPPEGVIGADITYAGPDGATLMGYLAQPDDGETHPGVIVIQEWWGLNDHIKDVANRIAAEGFVALAPDLYHGVAATEPDEARKLVMELDQAAAVDEIGSAMQHLLTLDNVSGETVGVVGFCMGGGLAARTNVGDQNELVGAVVMFYGQPLAEHEGALAHAPLLGLFGEADTGITPDAIAAMQSGLEAAGIPVETVIYPDAQHAFFNDTRASYNADASADAWERTLAWFNEHLG